MAQTRAIFIVHDGYIFLIWHDGLPDKLSEHLAIHPPSVYGDTHIAEFAQTGNRYAFGELTNTMPGSTFTHYAFERSTCMAGSPRMDLIIGWYWDEK